MLTEIICPRVKRCVRESVSGEDGEEESLELRLLNFVPSDTRRSLGTTLMR